MTGGVARFVSLPASLNPIIRYFHKRRVPVNKHVVGWPQPADSILSCSHPLLAQPPADLPHRLVQRKPHNATLQLNPKQAQR
jgi:hypothetical protein